MLERVDRIQMAVAEAAPAARAFQDILGAELAREDDSEYLNAHRTILALGASEVELCAPRGAGVVRAHLDRWGPGLLTAGFSVASVCRKYFGIDAEYIGYVNHDEAARRSVRARQPLVDAHPRSDAARYLARVARKLAGDPAAARPAHRGAAR